MDGFRMDAADEFMHQPDAAINFNESVYTNAADPRLPLGGWMRLGNRVNEGYAELSVCLYLPDGRIACQFQRPGIRSNDAFNAGGLRVTTIEPLRRIEMEYTGEIMLIDDPNLLRDPKAMFVAAERHPAAILWQHEGVSPVHGGEPTNPDMQTMYGRDFSRGHFNQHTRVRGHVRIGDNDWDFDGNGWRDHSWGARYWQVIYYYRLFTACFPDGRGFMLLKINDVSGHARRVGVLLVEGQYEEIVDMDVSTEWSDRQDPVRVRIGVRTARRAAIIDAEIIRLAPLRNRRTIEGETLVTRIAEGFTKFTWAGAVGYGMTEYIERMEGDRLVGYPL